MLFHKCRCGALIPQNIAECEACAAKAAGQQSRHMEYNKHRRNKKTAAFYVSSEWRKTRAETIRRFDGVDIYAFYEVFHRASSFLFRCDVFCIYIAVLLALFSVNVNVIPQCAVRCCCATAHADFCILLNARI